MPYVIAQLPPGTEDAIAAASSRGWEAVVLVILMIGGFSFFGFMFRQYSAQAQEREQRLSGRVTHLEDLIRDKLFQTIDENAKLIATMVDATDRVSMACVQITESLGKFATVLENRPCMAMDAAERARLVDALVDRLPEGVVKQIKGQV